MPFVPLDLDMSPYTKIGKLYDNKELAKRLAGSIRYILKLAYMTAKIGYLEHLDTGMGSFITKLRKNISANKELPINFHPQVKINKKDEFKFEVYGQKEDPHGNKVSADKIIPGRTTYWSPAIQK